MGWHKSGPGKRERGRDEARRTCGGKEEGNESEANGHAIVREKIYRYTMRARTAQGIDSSVSNV